MTPNDRKYSKEHEWILQEGDTVKLGVSDFAQESMGDIVYVELPVTGERFAVGDSIAVLESVKAVSNVYTPVAGEVIEVNDALEGEPERINQDPYGTFIVVIKPDEVDESALLDAAAYDAFIAESH